MAGNIDIEREKKALDRAAGLIRFSDPMHHAVLTTVEILAHEWFRHHVPTLEIEQISSLATTVIGERDGATKWLSEPNAALDNRSPIELIGEPGGFERVKSLLLRIEYGVLA